MSHEFSILLSGYMAGVVFGSMVSVTIYRAMFRKGLRQSGGELD